MTQRRLMVDSIENIRDLGGCLTTKGQQTRWKSFLRADHFQSWTPATQQALIDYGVKLVIDLRTSNQIQASPNSFSQSEQVKYLNLSLIPDELHDGPRFQTLLNTMADNHEMYAFILDECKTAVGTIFTTIAIHNQQTTMFHCYAGKDRTGVVTALLLSLADVEDEVIVQDYALTGEYLAERISKVRDHGALMGEDTTRFDIQFASDAQSMRTTLNYLREKHSNARAYLRECGVSDTHIDVLRTLMIEDTP